MAQSIIQPGFKSGRLTVVGFHHAKPRTDSGGVIHYYLCQCECGNSPVVSGKDLTRQRNIKQCRKCRGRWNGLSVTPEGRAWRDMISRCRPESKFAAYYHARGITVCPEWRNSPLPFIKHIGPMPTPGLTVDRIKNDKGYEPNNVRWATRSEQQRNRRNNVLITFQGATLCLTEWAERLGVRRQMLANRITRGWTTEQVLTLPAIRGHLEYQLRK